MAAPETCTPGDDPVHGASWLTASDTHLEAREAGLGPDLELCPALEPVAWLCLRIH
jgi:hypothetical protein